MLRRLCLVGMIGMLSVGLLSPPVADARTTSRSLGRTLPEMNFDGVALTDAIDFLRDITAANIVVNWRALEAAGVTPDTVVNLKLRSVSLRKALSLLLSEAGGGEASITYTIDEGVIEVTTTELANARVYTRVYDVADLLMEIPDFSDAPDFSLESTSNSGGGSGGGGGGGGGGLFGDSGGQGGGGQGEEEDEGMTKAERAEELLSLIRDTIYPDIWRENGGTASIRMFRESMVVTAPRMVHEAIGGTWD